MELNTNALIKKNPFHITFANKRENRFSCHLQRDLTEICNMSMKYFQSIRDAVQECLQKEPKDRTEDDIETLLEFIQHFRVGY